jgi:imidazolonepropionase-like amidohydrolase
MSDAIFPSPVFAGYVKTLREAADWWLSPAGDTMIAHMVRTGVAITPALYAYFPWISEGSTQETRDGRQRVFEAHKELTRRFHKAGITILAGSDFGDRDYDVDPGRSLHQEMELLGQVGMTPEEVRRAASTNVIAWLKRRP